MKKTLSFLLALMMLFGIVSISIYASEETTNQVGYASDVNTDCTCGGSYGEWSYPVGGVCVGGRYERVCGSCGEKQTAKDVTTETISFSFSRT